MRAKRTHISCVALVVLCAATTATADSVEWFNNKSAWENAVGNFTTIDFTDYPDGTPITDQYAHLGTNFSGTVFIFESVGFINDGFGLHGYEGIWVHFDSYMHWLAVDHPGLVAFQLYKNGELLIEAGSFGGGGVGFFTGLVSDKPFDTVLIFRIVGGPHVFIDDLHFGAIVVPVPGALALFGLAVVGKRRRRLP